ncbi:MAG TPA: M14 family zinc carboxypeptidase [Bacteroidota bacterium]|nr:M14 family zinc carboxypeptidase [Bacteroidota bacterium]
MKSSSQVPFTQHLFETYEKYTAADITTNRISHASVMSHIDRFTESLNGIMTVEDLGRSAEGRAIKLLKLGAGSTTVFMWSQMHGDEPTATMALIDMLSYIRDNRETPEVKSILAGVTILILPMLNPDGAERFQRRTALGIDMNRDAARLQTPEAQILKNTRDRYNPQIGFNLHDMDTRFTVGTSDKVAAIALLAPAFDHAKTDNPVRARAKKVAATLADIFNQYLEGHISRYDDSYDPRAFGDRVQGWGTSTVLIESGGWKNDPRKMFLRKVNCVAYLSVLQAIATGSYESSDVARYETLNEHRRGLYDMIVEKVTLKFEHDMPSVVADLGIDISEILHAGAIRTEARIMDIGDLSPFHAFERVNAEGMAIDASTMKLESIVDLDKLRSLIGK